MKRVAWWVLPLLLLSAACTTAVIGGGGEPRYRDGGAAVSRADAEIAAAVRSGLYRDAALAPYAIRVEVRQGVVVLSGRVPDQALAARAASIAAAVAGVRRVESRLDH